jgi:hypothetical protein
MSYKRENIGTFDIDEEYSVEIEYQKTSRGFRHLAQLRQNGSEISEGKAVYCNRTRESWNGQTAVCDAIRKANLPEDVEARLNAWAEEGKEPIREEMAVFGMAAITATLGDIFCDTPKCANDWKKRMINTVPGIQFPEDFDELPDDVKKARLDGVIKQMQAIT